MQERRARNPGRTPVKFGRCKSPLIAALLLACVAASFWILRVHIAPPPEAKFSINDVSRYFYPLFIHMGRDLANGEFSLWNPYQMAGMPFLATQQAGQLYPPNAVLLSLFSPARAMDVHGALHLFIAGFFTWLYARRIGLGRAAAFCAGVTYMLSGAMLERFYATAYVSTCAWLPAIAWATHGLVRFARPRDAAAVAITVALGFLGGYSQGFVFEVQFGAIYGLVLLLFSKPAPNRTRVAWLTLASGAMMVGLVAAQLLPSLELLGEMPRAGERLSLVDAARFSEEPNVVLTGWLGQGHRFASTILALPLLALGLFDRRHRRAWSLFATGALLTGLFAMGERTPVFPLYHALPGGDLFRFPYRIDFIHAFCVSVLVGIGVSGAKQWVASWQTRQPWLPRAVTTAIAFIIVGDFLMPGHLPHALPVPPVESRGAPDELLAELIPRRFEGRVFNENFGAQYNSLMPYEFGRMNELFAIPTYEPMLPGAYTRYFKMDSMWRGFVNLVKPRGLSYGSTTDATSFPDEGLLRLLDLMSVRFYAAHAQLSRGRISELESAVGGKATRLGDAFLIERPGALPRTYIVHETIAEPDPERAWTRLLDPAFAPRRQAIVEQAESRVAPPVVDSRAEEAATITAYAGGSVEIAARCATPCLLVLTDLDYPGWEVEVDGQPQRILRVNTLFRGVVLEPGKHHVAYRYRPVSFRIGAMLSSATLVALLIAGGYGVYARRSSIPATYSR